MTTEKLFTTPTPAERLVWWATHPWQIVLRIGAEIYKFTHKGEPWISHHAVRFLEENLRPNMKGIELGSGRSTVWYAKRLGHLISIEHNFTWHKIVEQKIKEQNIQNIDYRYVPLDHPPEIPTPRDYEKLPAYVQTITNLENNSLDFAVVDGHYRQACIKALENKLKPGAFLLVDNTNWMKLEQWGVPPTWKVVHRTYGFEGETTIWQK